MESILSRQRLFICSDKHLPHPDETCRLGAQLCLLLSLTTKASSSTLCPKLSWSCRHTRTEPDVPSSPRLSSIRSLFRPAVRITRCRVLLASVTWSTWRESHCMSKYGRSGSPSWNAMATSTLYQREWKPYLSPPCLASTGMLPCPAFVITVGIKLTRYMPDASRRA